MAQRVSKGKFNPPIILLDTNILLNVIKENWHLNSLIENQIYQLYKIVVPGLIVKELKNLKTKKTTKIGAIRLANSVFESIDDSKYLLDSDYKLSVDSQLLKLAIKLDEETKVIIMTQDKQFKNKILNENIPVLLVSFGRSKLIKPINKDNI